VASITWGQGLAEAYDTVYAAEREPHVLDPVLEALTQLGGSGPVLEFAVGTGRVALPLAARGLAVHGIELSPHMAAQLQSKPGADSVAVTIGDMTTTRVPGPFRLVYLLANSLMNVTTQEEQVQVFTNAAAHLDPGGLFVVELVVPLLHRASVADQGRVFAMDPTHVGIETVQDTIAQVAWSHHWMEVSGRVLTHSAPYRYVWPSELVLMASLAGFGLKDRWGGWDRTPFTSDSASQVAIFERVH